MFDGERLAAALEALGFHAFGSRARIKQPRLSKVEWTVTALDAFADRAAATGARMSIESLVRVSLSATSGNRSSQAR